MLRLALLAAVLVSGCSGELRAGGGSCQAAYEKALLVAPSDERRSLTCKKCLACVTARAAEGKACGFCPWKFQKQAREVTLGPGACFSTAWSLGRMFKDKRCGESGYHTIFGVKETYVSFDLIGARAGPYQGLDSGASLAARFLEDAKNACYRNDYLWRAKTPEEAKKRFRTKKRGSDFFVRAEESNEEIDMYPYEDLPEGWRQVSPFSYENKNTGERVAWRPTEPAQPVITTPGQACKAGGGTAPRHTSTSPYGQKHCPKCTAPSCTGETSTATTGALLKDVNGNADFCKMFCSQTAGAPADHVPEELATRGRREWPQAKGAAGPRKTPKRVGFTDEVKKHDGVDEFKAKVVYNIMDYKKTYGKRANPVDAAAGTDLYKTDWRGALEGMVKRLEAAKAEGKTSIDLTNSQSASAKSSGAQGYKVPVSYIEWFKQVIAVPKVTQ